MEMEILRKVVKLRFHLVAVLIVCVGVGVLSPRLVSLIAYFWPLLLSTALFLLAVLVFARTSLPPPDLTPDGLLNYVAGAHAHHFDNPTFNSHYYTHNPPVSSTSPLT